MPNLDRFSVGRRDPQAEHPVTMCEGCGGEIYAYDDVYLIDGAILHADKDCLLLYVQPVRTQALEVAS